MNLKICPICRSLYPEDIEKCDCCKEGLIDNSIYKKWSEKQKNEYMKKYKSKYETKPSEVTIRKPNVIIRENLQHAQQQNIPKCPTCGSTNICKISTSKKALGFVTVGIFSSNFGKTMECKQCGYKW